VGGKAFPQNGCFMLHLHTSHLQHNATVTLGLGSNGKSPFLAVKRHRPTTDHCAKALQTKDIFRPLRIRCLTYAFRVPRDIVAASPDPTLAV
jgi:hypothetical protein